MELLTFLRAQSHQIFLYRDISCGHDSPPVAIVATEANQQILSNSLKRATSLRKASWRNRASLLKSVFRGRRSEAKASPESVTMFGGSGFRALGLRPTPGMLAQ